MTIDATDRQTLLSLARRSIELGLTEERLAPVPQVDSPALQEPRATFVTLRPAIAPDGFATVHV